MLCGRLAGGGVYGPHEFRVGAEFLEHSRVLATHRAVYDRGAGPLCHRSCGPNCHGAVNNRQPGLEKIDVAGGLTHKVLDLEREADMQNINLPYRPGRRRDVHADDIVVLRKEFKEWPANLSD